LTTFVYVVTGVGLCVVGAVGIALSLRRDGVSRTMSLVGAVIPIAMGLSYLGMYLELLTVQTTGREQSIVRFFGYTVTAIGTGYIIRRIIDLSRRQFLLLTTVILLFPWMTLLAWLVGGVLESVVTLLILASYLAGVYLLFGPLGRVARERGGERLLWFAKIRNLSYFTYGVLILMSLLSTQVLGLTDQATAQLAASYADVVLVVGLMALTFNSAETVDRHTTA
jgi:bacteriorhodopsin